MPRCKRLRDWRIYFTDIENDPAYAEILGASDPDDAIGIFRREFSGSYLDRGDGTFRPVNPLWNRIDHVVLMKERVDG